MGKILLSISCFILLLGCSTTPVGSGKETDVGVWQGKVQMLSKESKNRKWAYVTWISDSPNQRMRIDVRAVLDIPIATYIRKEDGAHLWLFTEGKYFHSKDATQLFSTLVKFNFDPDHFFNFLGNPQKLGKSWECENKLSLYTCLSPSREAQVTINHENVDKRVINLNKGSKGLRIRLSRSKVRVTAQQFKKLSTSQFDIIEI